MRYRAIATACIISMVAVAAGPPHAAYGPNYIGFDDVIRVDVDTECNVFAVSSYDYENYTHGRNFRYFGGRASYSPFYITPPSGSYIVVIDNGGASINGIRTAVHVIHK